MIDLRLLQEKAPDYIACFNDDCALHDHCLRWQVGQVPESSSLLRTIVNPHHPSVQQDRCEYYRDDQLVRVGIGMVNFFHDMPHYIELAIKKDIIRHFNRTCYYRMRNGTIPVSPDAQAVIADICRRHGWTAEPRYDSYAEHYLW